MKYRNALFIIHHYSPCPVAGAPLGIVVLLPLTVPVGVGVTVTDVVTVGLGLTVAVWAFVLSKTTNPANNAETITVVTAINADRIISSPPFT